MTYNKIYKKNIFWKDKIIISTQNNLIIIAVSCKAM